MSKTDLSTHELIHPSNQKVLPNGLGEFIDPSHIKKLLSYIVPIGGFGYSTSQEVTSPHVGEAVQGKGFWLIRAPETESIDESGWYCIHWPRLLLRLAWMESSSGYLRRTGHHVRLLQNMRLPELERAHNQISALKAGLLATLPPGSLLTAENSFFHQLVGSFVGLDEHEYFDNSPIRASLGPWSLFRWGALARKTENSFETAANRHDVLCPWSICKVDNEVLSACPEVIRVLLSVLRLARGSDGRGWQRWGLAWVKAGLIFNYQIAISSILEDPRLSSELLPNGNVGECMGRWAGEAHLHGKPALRDLPKLGDIARSDVSAQAYMSRALAPYKMLFQDIDPNISANAVYHDNEYRFLFPIKKDGSVDLLSYVKQLIHLSDTKNNQPIYKANAPIRIRSKREVEKDVKLIHRTYRVCFNAYNLGCTLPPPVEGVTVLPFQLDMVPYKGEYYFSYPDVLETRCPELSLEKVYKPVANETRLQWFRNSEHILDCKVLSPAERNQQIQRVNCADVIYTLPKQALPYVHNVQNRRFFHPAVFAPGGIGYAVMDAVSVSRPEMTEEILQYMAVLKNLWAWVYDPTPGFTQGKYAEEFVYPLGRDTNHCPEDLRLTTSVKRFQFIVDKALHALDEPVAYLPAHTGDRHAPRSKKANSYDQFLLWYVAHHELALLPWILDKKEQAEYITKRWMPWRRWVSAMTMLHNPYPAKTKRYDRPKLEDVFEYANETFGLPFTQY